MVVFDGRLHVHYGQAYVFSGDADETAAMDACFRGQTNGLVGAVLPGQLFLLTGLHTGDVEFRVELASDEPPCDERWDEGVEVSFEPAPGARLVDWNRNVVCELPLDPGTYRVRYQARGMDAANEADTILADQPPIDQYLLSFWPAPSAPDRIVKQTAANARYWHQWAQAL